MTRTLGDEDTSLHYREPTFPTLPALRGYPETDCREDALGIFILVQLKKPLNKTKGGIILSDESRDTDQYMVDRGIVRSIGPIAFRYRDTGQSWPGHPSIKVGDEVRVPVYGGTVFFVHEADPEKKVKFGLFRDNEILSKIKE